MVLSGVVAMVTCAVFLRLSCVLKLAVLLSAAALYTYLIDTHRCELSSTSHDLLALAWMLTVVLCVSGLITCAGKVCAWSSWRCSWAPSSTTADM